MKNQAIPTVNTVQVNGKEVLDFSPQSTTQLVIVPLSVIQKLASLLDNSNLSEIIRTMRTKLGNHEVDTMEKYVQILQDEIDFHNTVNLLTMYQPEEERLTLVAKYSV